jgi:hypothetical protein
MFKKILFAFSALAILVFPLVACSPDNEVSASFGKEFTLPVGSTAVFQTDDLRIKFGEVTADSRCPKGVQCVWAGEAKCALLIGRGTSLSAFELVDIGGQSGYSTASFRNNDYNLTFSFKVEPYPEAGKNLDSGAYILLLTVNKVS